MRDDLKELLKDCKTEEEALQLLKEQNVDLSDAELEELRGGTLIVIDCLITLTCF